MFSGIYTALITPFKDGKIDEDSLVKIIKNQIEAGVSGVVICGTTGESPTLSHEEHNYAIDLAIAACAGKIKVIAGTGSNSTREAIATTKHAEKAGADGALIVSPYYNKPSQEGMYQHFKEIHNSTNIPIILYDVPGRTIVQLSTELVVRLSKLERVIAIKDATGDLSLPAKINNLTENLLQLTGDDATTLPFYSVGGDGCISVTSNIVPNLCVELYQEFKVGNIARAIEINNKLAELNDVLFIDSNPVPVKYAASLLNMCEGDLRLPLIELSDEKKEKVKNALHNLGLL